MKKKQSIILIISIIALIVCVSMVIVLQRSSSKIKNEILTLKQEALDLKGKAERTLTVREAIKASGSSASLDNYFIGGTEALDFVTYVESLAVSSGLTFTIDLADTMQDESLTGADKEFLRLALRSTGSIKNIRRFLSLLETMPYNVKVTRFDLRRNSASTASAALPSVDSWSMVIDFSTVKQIDNN